MYIHVCKEFSPYKEILVSTGPCPWPYNADSSLRCVPEAPALEDRADDQGHPALCFLQRHKVHSQPGASSVCFLPFSHLQITLGDHSVSTALRSASPFLSSSLPSSFFVYIQGSAQPWSYRAMCFYTHTHVWGVMTKNKGSLLPPKLMSIPSCPQPNFLYSRQALFTLCSQLHVSGVTHCWARHTGVPSCEHICTVPLPPVCDLFLTLREGKGEGMLLS